MSPNETENQVDPATSDNKWVMPDEACPHERTWMSFGAQQSIWGKRLLEEVRQNIADVAQSIAKYEPVTICVRPEELQVAKQYFDDLSSIEFLECPLDDLWIRDYGAVYVLNSSNQKAAIDFNFNGWGEKQKHKSDSQVAAWMAKESRVEIIQTELCLEGGGIEVDGQGTAIVTESCVINENRNPGWNHNDCENELARTLGIEKVIWLPGVRGADITDGHTDFYARFADAGTVMAHLDPKNSSSDYKLTRQHLEILQASTDAQGNKLNVVALEAPTSIRPKFASKEFCAGYVNFYVCNDAVIAPQFGDNRADQQAKQILASAFPDREIEMVAIDGIAAGGGGIHCATQQEPKV